MKFRIRSKEGDLLSPENVFLAQNGKAYCEGLLGFEEIKGAKPEFLVGVDSLGNDVYENDTLLSEYSVYTAGFDLDIGAVLLYNGSGKIPFKQCAEKLVLKEMK